MPILKFLCPTTRAYFDSGIRLDETSAAASRLKIVLVRCRQCHRDHRFLVADGTLDLPETLMKRPAAKKSRVRRIAAGRIGPRRHYRASDASIAAAKHMSP